MAPKQELTRLALEERVARTDLSLTSFRRNFAVCEATVNGQTVHPKAFNDEGELHSETLLVRQLEEMDPRLTNTQVSQIYSEREPCSNCTNDIEGLRRRLRRDMGIFYTVSQRTPLNLRARRLMEAYCLRPPQATPRTSPAGSSSGPGVEEE